MHPVVKRIEKRRKEKGVTKGHLARRCSKSPSWYSKILSEDRKPTIDDISAIAEALDEEPGYFFEQERDKLESLQNQPKHELA